MNRKWHFQLTTGIVVAVVVVVVAAVLVPFGAAAFIGTPLANPANPQTSGLDLRGDFDGSVTLNGVYQGVYNDPSATPSAMDLGYIDLALHLDQSGDALTGHVTLDRVLVFTREHTIMVTPVGPTPAPPTPAPTPHALDIGPYVQGAITGTKVYLESEPFVMVMNGRQITRRFSLSVASIQANGNVLNGTYRETIWGYAQEPSTVVGTFELRRPIYGSLGDYPYQVYLPILRR